MLKRSFDIFFSSVAFLVFCLPVALFACLLKFKEKHPVVFRQQRLGKDKKPFTIYKLQTMVDEQVTPIGRILRKTGLDEVAQFMNVLKGDMSIVGPRALTLQDVERLGWNDDAHSSRWAVKPGISGYAQIFATPGKKISWFWDRKYVASHTLARDFGVLLVSFAMNIFGKPKVKKVIFKRKKR